MNKVKYGLSNVYYAKATIDATTGAATYQTPVKIPGAVNLSLDAQGESNKFRADNIDYYVSQKNDGYEGDLEIAIIPDSFRKDILGDIEDDDGVLAEDMGALTVPFALLFQFEGDEKATRHVLYNCTAGRPSVTGQTTEETIEPQTETISLTAGSVHNASLDKDIVRARTLKGDAQYDTWFGAVYQPVITPGP